MSLLYTVSICCLVGTATGTAAEQCADQGCLSRIRIFSIPDPESRVKKIRVRNRIKEYCKYYNSINLFLSSRKCDPGCSSRIRILIFYPIRIPDSGLKMAPDPGSGSATLLLSRETSLCIPNWSLLCLNIFCSSCMGINLNSINLPFRYSSAGTGLFRKCHAIWIEMVIKYLRD